jgi:hypothetical protein
MGPVRMRNFLMTWILVGILIFSAGMYGCGGGQAVPPTTPVTQTQVQSPKMIAFKTVDMAFDAYDFGMTTLRTLQQQKVITAAQYDSVKAKVGWPFYNAIKLADDAMQAWVAAGTDSAYGKMNAAFQGLVDAQKNFTALVNSLQGGKK